MNRTFGGVLKGLNGILWLAGVGLIVYALWFRHPSGDDFQEPGRPVDVEQPFHRRVAPSPAPSAPPAVKSFGVMKEIQAPPPAKVEEGKTPEWPKGVVEFEVAEGKYAIGFGDIILGLVPEDKRHLERAYFEPPKSRLWPSSEIPFSIDEATPNRDQIMAAIEHFHSETPIRFVPFSDQESSVLFMPAEKLCASQIGHTGGHQVILISSECSKNEIIHEILHTLGFIHEHSREDRDKFVEVLWSNIDPKYYLQFQMAPDSWASEYRGSVFDFDPKSIMLYPPNLFGKEPGLETLRPKSGILLEPSKQGLSKTDKERVYYLYGQ